MSGAHVSISSSLVPPVSPADERSPRLRPTLAVKQPASPSPPPPQATPTMDSAHDPLAAISASAPFPTIPAAASPRPRGARPRRHAAPFRSDHQAASAATSASRRYGSDVSRRPAASSSALQEGSPSVGSRGAATFVFGSGVVGASETTKIVSSGSGEGSLSNMSSEVDKLALDGSGWQNDPDASCPLPAVNVGDSLGTRGSNSSYSIGDQTELVDEGSGVLSQTIRCQSVETRSLASQAVHAATCTDGNISTRFVKSGDSLLVRDSVDEGNFSKDGSKISAHGGDAQQNIFVFGEHAGYQQFTTNADQPDVNKVDSADKDGVTYRFEQLNDSTAKDSTCTKFILQDAEHAFGSGNSDPPHTQSQEISAALRASDAVPSNLGYEDACAKVSFNNSTLKTTESSHDRAEFMSSAKMEQPGQSDFTFSASTFDQSTLTSQKRHNKKKVGGMGSHTKSVQSRPTSIGIASSGVSESQQCMDLAAQWTDNRKMQPKVVTVSRGVTDNFGHHGDCEAWRLRGNEAFAEGQLTKAEECYTQGIDSFSSTEASRKSLMLCYSNRAAARMSLGKMREALSDCQEAIDIDPCFLKAQVRAANCLLALGDVEEAQKVFEMCLKSNHLSNLDHKIVEETSDGLQKVQKLSDFIHQSKEYLVTKALDKIPNALQMISDALSISIYSDNLMAMKAEALLMLRRYEETIQFCQETLYVAERNSICFCPGENSESNNFDTNCCSVKLWCYHLIAKSYFFLGKLEESQQFLKKYEQTKATECRCGKQSQQSISSFSMAISELLRLKAEGNEAFQAGKYSVAVECYTTALLRNTESLHFSAICLCNRAAAYQAMGQMLDAIADCSLAIALDSGYSKAISRRSSLYELLRDYDQATNDIRRLISLLEKQLQENISTPSEQTDSIRSNLNRANLRLATLEQDARKGATLNIYMILGIDPSCPAVDIKKAYRKAALRHHPDKAGKSLVRSENISDELWGEITNEIRRDADYLFKLIGKAYAMLSDPTMKSN